MEGFVPIDFDPYGGRLIWYVYGEPKVGKTTLLLKMIKEHRDQYAFLLSADRGTRAARIDPKPYAGHLAVAYPASLRDWRVTIKQLTEKVGDAIKKGVKPMNIWICIDNVTTMQIMLLMEGRKIASSKGKEGGSNEGATRVVDDASYARDLQTQMDWGINLGLMTELVINITALPGNILFIAHEKDAKDEYGRPVIIPAVSGQSGAMLLGLSDVIARMVKDRDSNRKLVLDDASCFAGNRECALDKTEPPDLYAAHHKALSNAPATAPASPPAEKPVT